jgi:hypothetical protein
MNTLTILSRTITTAPEHNIKDMHYCHVFDYWLQKCNTEFVDV